MRLWSCFGTLALATALGCDRPSPPQPPAPAQAAPPAPTTAAPTPAPTPAPQAGEATPAPAGATAGTSIDETEARRKVAEVYGLLTDTTVDVLSAEDLGHTWKVIFRLRGREGTPDQTSYITKDGRWVTDQLLELTEYTDRLRREKRFAECLADKGLRVYVAPGDPTSQKIIDAIGSYAHRVAVDCRANPTSCQNLGIELLPTMQLGEVKEPGAKDRAFIENLSGCKL